MLRLPKLTEKAFMAQVVQLAKLRGWLVYHTFDARRSVPGFPDLLLIRGSRLIAAELKVGKRRATPAQLDWLVAFAGAGAMALIWRPDDWPEIERVLGQD